MSENNPSESTLFPLLLDSVFYEIFSLSLKWSLENGKTDPLCSALKYQINLIYMNKFITSHFLF